MSCQQQPNDVVAARAGGPGRSAGPAAGPPAGGRSVPAGERPRLASVDALRGLSAVLIAAHHICLYGPLPGRAATLLPWVVKGLAAHGRLAVQVFLVIGGFAAALAVGHARGGPAGFVRLAVRRYVRLGFPYLAAALSV